VQAVRRAVAFRKVLRVGEDHAEDHRPFFFAQQARLVAGGQQGFEDRPVGQSRPFLRLLCALRVPIPTLPYETRQVARVGVLPLSPPGRFLGRKDPAPPSVLLACSLQ
jgi:hypothetical protein